METDTTLKTTTAWPAAAEAPSRQSAPNHGLPTTLEQAKLIVKETFGEAFTAERPNEKAWQYDKQATAPGPSASPELNHLLDLSPGGVRHQIEQQCLRIYGEKVLEQLNHLLDILPRAIENQYDEHVALHTTQKMLIAAEFLLFSINYPVPQHEIITPEDERAKPLGTVATPEGFIVAILFAAISEIELRESAPASEVTRPLQIIDRILTGAHVEYRVQDTITAIQNAITAKRYIQDRQLPMINKHIQAYHTEGPPPEQGQHEYFTPSHVFSTHLELTGQRGDFVAQCFVRLEHQAWAGLALLIDHFAVLELHRRELGVKRIPPRVNGAPLAVHTHEQALIDAYLALPIMTLCEYMFEYGVVYFRLGEAYLSIVSPRDYAHAAGLQFDALAMRVTGPDTPTTTLTPDPWSKDRAILAAADGIQLLEHIMLRFQFDEGTVATARAKKSQSTFRKFEMHPMIAEMAALRDEILVQVRDVLLGLKIPFEYEVTAETLQLLAEQTGQTILGTLCQEYTQARNHYFNIFRKLQQFSGLERAVQARALREDEARRRYLEVSETLRTEISKDTDFTAKDVEIESLRALAIVARKGEYVELADWIQWADDEDRVIQGTDLRGRAPMTAKDFREYLRAFNKYPLDNFSFDTEGITLNVNIEPSRLQHIKDDIALIIEEELNCRVIKGSFWEDPVYHAYHLVVAFFPDGENVLRLIEIKIVPSTEAWYGGADHLIYNMMHKYLFINYKLNKEVLFAASANPEITLQTRVQLGEHLGEDIMLVVNEEKRRCRYELDLNAKTLSGLTPADILIQEGRKRGLSTAQIIQLLLHPPNIPPVIRVQSALIRREGMHLPLAQIYFDTLERTQASPINGESVIPIEVNLPQPTKIDQELSQRSLITLIQIYSRAGTASREVIVTFLRDQIATGKLQRSALHALLQEGFAPAPPFHTTQWALEQILEKIPSRAT